MESPKHTAVMGRRVALALATLLSLALIGCSESRAPDCGRLEVEGPWVREAAPGAGVMGAYFTLVNNGDSKVVVNGVDSSQFDRAEMHETVVNDDGQASMQPIKQVAIAAGERVEFKSGGRHVMLFSPSQTYAAGDQVELILACGTQGAELPAAATVRAEQPGAADSSAGGQGMNQGSMDHESMDQGSMDPDKPMNDDAMNNDATTTAESAGDANEDSASAE